MTDKLLNQLEKKGIGSALDTVAKGSIDGASAFLGRICLPAAEEFGLVLKDKIQHYRAKNILKITEQAKNIIDQLNNPELQAHPRIVSTIVEKGSWASEEELQEKWAGLLASSCTESGTDDSNLMFVELLGNLSNVQVKIIDYACTASNKTVEDEGVLIANTLTVSLGELLDVASIDDINRIHREVAHLRTTGLLIDGTIQIWTSTVSGAPKKNQDDLPDELVSRTVSYTVDNVDLHQSVVNITPSDLAFHLYTRSKGYGGPPLDYFFNEDDYWSKK